MATCALGEELAEVETSVLGEELAEAATCALAEEPAPMRGRQLLQRTLLAETLASATWSLVSQTSLLRPEVVATLPAEVEARGASSASAEAWAVTAAAADL